MDWTAEIDAAAQRIAGHVVQTPVAQIAVPGVDGLVAVKFEQMQHTGSFKARGAFNTLLAAPVPPAGVVAASGGNHGAAVAYAARRLGQAAHIFVPEIAGAAKIALIRRTGADLTVVPGQYADAAAAAEAYQARTGALQIHPYDAAHTIAGQGTLMREWHRQGLEADTALIAVGGGGLIAGALAWNAPGLRIVAVEPSACPTLHTALAQGAPCDVGVSGIAANALGARRIGAMCFDLASARGTAAVLVPDDAITQAQRWLWDAHRQLVEPAGATALAALMSGAYRPKPGERVAVLVCGGNIAPDPFGD